MRLSISHRYALHVAARQVQNHKRPPGHALQRPRIDDARFADAMLLGDVRVAVKDEIESVGVFEIVQPLRIVPVRKARWSNSPSRDDSGVVQASLIVKYGLFDLAVRL